MLIKTSAVALALLIPMSAVAEEIKQRSYGYSYDVAKSVNSDVFIVCSDCRDDTLTKVPVPIKLAMRVSAEEPLAKPIQNPVIQKQEEASANKQATIQSGLIGSVLFDFDRSLLVKSEQENLDQISGQIPADKNVDVTGYTCSIGTDDYNKRLSYKRASSVASYLMTKGVTIGRVEGKGKCCPVSENNKINRRVEVEIR
jgi:outer membrane protein OmpA-like peptidoglycan-associated protein